MNFEIRLHRAAQKELDRLPEKVFTPIDAAIWTLHSNPRPSGSKKLQGDLYRIRVGSWRIIYAILDKQREVVILRVARRNEKTYKRLPPSP